MGIETPAQKVLEITLKLRRTLWRKPGGRILFIRSQRARCGEFPKRGNFSLYPTLFIASQEIFDSYECWIYIVAGLACTDCD